MPTPTIRLRELRNDHDLTQRELAQRTGVSERTIRRVESGHTLYVGTAMRLARGLGCRFDNLIAD